MSNTQPNLDSAAQKKQKRDQLLGKLCCIVVLSLWWFSHALDRYHENIKREQRQALGRSIVQTVQPQPVFHFDLGTNKSSGSQAAAIVHRTERPAEHP